MASLRDKIFGLIKQGFSLKDNTDATAKRQSAKVLLDFAYFFESEASRDLTNLLQRLSILIAADAALIGLWGNIVFGLVPRLELPNCCQIISIIALLVPIILLGISLLLAALALRYKPFPIIDPGKIIEEEFLEGEPEDVMVEIAAAYKTSWQENRATMRTRTKRFNSSIILLLVAVVWIAIASSIFAFIPLGD